MESNLWARLKVDDGRISPKIFSEELARYTAKPEECTVCEGAGVKDKTTSEDVAEVKALVEEVKKLESIFYTSLTEGGSEDEQEKNLDLVEA